MIVRIMGEGQFEVPSESVAKLNEIDARLETSLEEGRREDFRAILADLVALVRADGERLPEESLEASDAVLPSEDTTAEELRRLLKEEGLIPGR